MDRPTPSASGMTRVCKLCEKSFAMHEIRRCPVCHTYFCRTCGVLSSGRRFCSRGCGLFDAFYETEASTSPRRKG